MKQIIRSISISILFSLLVACGSDSSTTTASGTDTTSINHKSILKSGLYKATSGGSYLGLVSKNEIKIKGQDGILEISINTSKQSITGSGHSFINGKRGSLKVTGSFNNENNGSMLDLHFIDNKILPENIKFRMWSDITNKGASLEQIKGKYTTVNQNIDLEISALGTIKGHSQDGCDYTGDVEIPDPKINIYKIYFTMKNCTSAGEYTALASFLNENELVTIGKNNSYKIYK